MRGSLRKRSKDSWTIILSLGRDPETGKKRQRWVTVRGTRRDAERKLAELLHQVHTGALVKAHKLTVADFLKRWLEDYAATSVRPRTLEGYRQRASHLVAGLGHIPLVQLEPGHLQSYYAQKLAQGLSARTVLAHHRLLSEALGHGVKWGLVMRNVAQAVDPPRPGRKEMRALTAKEVALLLKAARATPFYALFHTAVWTGLRRSELLGLKWEDVNLDGRILIVSRGLHRLQNGRIAFHEPKTPKARRQVALAPSSALVLRSHRERQEADFALMGLVVSDDTLVFCRPDGKPWIPTHVTRSFHRLAHRVGLDGVRFTTSGTRTRPLCSSRASIRRLSKSAWATPAFR